MWPSVRPRGRSPGAHCRPGLLRLRLRVVYETSTAIALSYSTVATHEVNVMFRSQRPRPSQSSSVVPPTLRRCPVATGTPVAGEGVLHLDWIAAVAQPEREGNGSRNLNTVGVAQGAVVAPARPSRCLPSSAEQALESSVVSKVSAFVVATTVDLAEVSVNRVEVLVERHSPRQWRRSPKPCPPCVSRRGPGSSSSVSSVAYRFGGGISAFPSVFVRAYHMETKRCRASAASSKVQVEASEGQLARNVVGICSVASAVVVRTGMASGVGRRSTSSANMAQTSTWSMATKSMDPQVRSSQASQAIPPQATSAPWGSSVTVYASR